MPDGTWSVAFLPTSRVMESYPVQVVVDLDASPHGGGNLEDPATHEVRGQWRSEAKVGSVTVMCRGTTLTRISPVETAY